jgi:peptide/nickel transport system ATP-binding protein
MRHLQHEYKMALILITHNLGVIAQMADEIAVMYLGRVIETAPVETIFTSPKHPYTQGLLRSLPSIHSETRAKLPTISGSVPNPFFRPSGCSFHPRCPSFMSGVCDQRVPQLLPLGETHKVSCFLYHRE